MTNNPRYTLGTEANRIFMASETYELLKFGKGFPAPDGGSGWLNADGTLDPSHGVETWITSVWPMCTRSATCSDIRAPGSWSTRRYEPDRHPA